jgi:hypothetical protein
MSVHWYLAPYDVVDSPDLGRYRQCSMMRYLPTEEPGRPHWTEVEVLGNHTLVKVNVSDAIHAEIASDPDFLDVVSASPAQVRDKLLELGYSMAESARASQNFRELLATLEAAGRNRVVNLDDVRPERKPLGRSMKDLEDSPVFERASR